MPLPTAEQLRNRRLRLKRRYLVKLDTDYPSQREVAALIPVHYVTLCNWERGKKKPSPVYLGRWQEVLRTLELSLSDNLPRSTALAAL